MSIARITKPAVRMTADTTSFELDAIVVRRISIDRVDVIDGLLRRVLDDQRRALDAEIRDAAVGRRTAPREVGLVQVRLDFRHARLGDAAGGDADPLTRDVPEHGLLRGAQRRSAD